jgi:hypothetical protein
LRFGATRLLQRATTRTLGRMLAKTLDRTLYRVIVGVAFGVPLTALTLLGCFFGFVYGIEGLRRGDLLFLALGAITLLGVLGFAGAWTRILRTHQSMSRGQRITVRYLLSAGVVASLSLAGLSFTWSPYTGLAFIVLAFGGITFILATPLAPKHVAAADVPRAVSRNTTIVPRPAAEHDVREQ